MVGVLAIVMFLSFAAQCVRVGHSGLVLQTWYRTPEFHPYTHIRRIILKRRGYLLVARVELETGELRPALDEAIDIPALEEVAAVLLDQLVDCRADIYEAWLALGCCLICFRRLQRG